MLVRLSESETIEKLIYKECIETKRKILATILSLSLLTGLMTGCGSDKSGDATASSTAASTTDGKPEPVTLDWYLGMYKIYDNNDRVLQVAAKMIEEKLNTKVNFHVSVNADYKTKMTTMLSAGQSLDIMYVSPLTVPFQTYAKQKAFYPLEDLLKKDFPDLYNAVPEETWNGVTVDGHIYAVVPFKDLADNLPIMYDKVIADKYKIKVPEPEKWTSLYDWVDTIYALHDARNKEFPDAAKEPSFTSMDLYFGFFNPYETLGSVVGATIPGIEAFQGKGNGETAFNIYDTPEYLKYCQTMRKFVEDGLYPSDVVNWNKSNPMPQGIEKTKYLWNVMQGYVVVEKGVNPNFEINQSAYKVMSTAYVQAMLNAVSANSKNPARALEVLNMVNTDSQLRTTLSFGVENVDWKKSGKDTITFEGTKNADPKARSYYQYYGAWWGGIQNLMISDKIDPTFKSKIKELNDKANKKVNLGFLFNPEPVQNQIAACANVIGQYDAVLKFGMVQDVEKTVKEFVAKLKENGADQIVAEAQKQLTEWRTKSGKK